MILTGRAAYVAIVFMFLLVVSVRVPWQTRSADWIVLGSRTMTVTLTRREGRRTPSLLRYSLELVAQFQTKWQTPEPRELELCFLLLASCRVLLASCILLFNFCFELDVDTLREDSACKC